MNNGGLQPVGETFIPAKAWLDLPVFPDRMTPPATHVGWGGRTAQHSTDMDLGRGSSRGVHQTFGIRRAVWDFAFGYVSGIPLRSIAYYLVTRSLNRHVARWAMKREGVRFEGWLPVVTAEFMTPPTLGPTGGAGDSGAAAE